MRLADFKASVSCSEALPFMNDNVTKLPLPVATEDEDFMEQLLADGRSYWAEAYPNPERQGCPPAMRWQTLVQSQALPDVALSDHLFSCAECFTYYRQTLAAREAKPPAQRAVKPVRQFAFVPRGVRRWGVVAASVLLLVGGAVWWATLQKPVEVAQQQQRDTTRNAAPKTLELALSEALEAERANQPLNLLAHKVVQLMAQDASLMCARPDPETDAFSCAATDKGLRFTLNASASDKKFLRFMYQSKLHRVPVQVK